MENCDKELLAAFEAIDAALENVKVGPERSAIALTFVIGEILRQQDMDGLNVEMADAKPPYEIEITRKDVNPRNDVDGYVRLDS